MRTVGALVLVVVLAAAMVETRPYEETRSYKICTSRDVKVMANYVCNLHRRRRSVLSLDDARDNYGVPGLLLENRSRRLALPQHWRPEDDTDTGNVSRRDPSFLQFTRIRRQVLLGEIRKQCCVHGCTPRDFYGACQ
uniref:Insulin-like peptide 2 n=1 Tax=Sagmariasus verreauxi TaxID=1412110 RepID=A0A0N6Z631_9EUCA|nr:insulin-like peptide 2 [Sagmariasus verreauxi]